jgi:cyclohexanecarboxylate-CoA ligase
VSLCGAVLLPVVMTYGPRELDFILRQSGAVGLAVPQAYRGDELPRTPAGKVQKFALRALAAQEAGGP